MYSVGDRMRLCRHGNIVPLKNRRRKVSVIQGAKQPSDLGPATYSPTVYQCLMCGLIGDKGEPLEKFHDNLR